MESTKIDQLAIKTIKVNGVAAVNQANSGHPGIVLGAAKILHVLFAYHLKYDPQHPNWINRDRFILSAGHGSALLYTMLRLLKQISKEDLSNFRCLDSITPGHPEYGLTQGVEATTGPLGQGIANAVGIAIAEANLNARFSEIDHYTYVLCGDGDLQEGVANEALSFAGHQKLHKLIILYDSNDVQLDTFVNKTFSENTALKMSALGFDYQLVTSNTVSAIDQAITKAKKSSKPSLIEIKTIIGEGATKQGTSAVHGAPLKDDFKNLKKRLNWTYDDFTIPEAVKVLYQKSIFARGAKIYKQFQSSEGLKKFLKHSKVKISLQIETNLATRSSSGQVIQYLNQNLEQWIGGSADLSVSTKAKGGEGEFSSNNRLGRNILFGVREFAMAAIANGLALHSNFKPFVSTFLVFADYMKPAIRLAALMKLPITYVFTHDSILLGEDGPTHQPIEQVAMLRSTPNLNFIRPADEKEVIAGYEIALNSQKTPTAIALTRQNIESIGTTDIQQAKQQGAYLIHQTNSIWTIVASGSELANAYRLGQKFNCNVVSLFCTKFAKITWDVNKAISIEAATTYGMSKFAKFNIGINSFGASGLGQLVYQKYGFNYQKLKTKIEKILTNASKQEL